MFRRKQQAAPPMATPEPQIRGKIRLKLCSSQIVDPDIVHNSQGSAIVLNFRRPNTSKPSSFMFRPVGPKWPGNTPAPTRIDVGLPILLNHFAATSLSKLSGRIVRTLVDESERLDEVWAIGDFLQDRWFSAGGSEWHYQEGSFV